MDLIEKISGRFSQIKKESTLFSKLPQKESTLFIAEFKGTKVDEIDGLTREISDYIKSLDHNDFQIEIVRGGWLPRKKDGTIEIDAAVGKWLAVREARKTEMLLNGQFGVLPEADKDSFAYFGSHSKIRTPVEISFPRYVKVGNWVSLGRYGKIVMLPTEAFADTEKYVKQHYPELVGDLKKFPVHAERTPTLKFGDGTSIGDNYFFICTKSIEFGKHVMVSGRLFVTDCQHMYEGSEIPPMLLPNTEGRSVKIEDHVWIGINCSILDGVTIGKHAVVGAHSVVKEDVPPYCLVAGSPAIIKKRFSPLHDAK